MRKNISELEQRLIFILKKNSRMSILEIADELGVSRTTAKKTMDSLINNGRIKKFTILLDDEEKDLGLVYTDNIENIPENLVLEYFKLINNSYVAVMYFEDILKVENLKIKHVEIAKSRKSNENSIRANNVHCDYCHAAIRERPIVLEIGKKTYYACCPNCERDLRKRVETIEDESPGTHLM